MLGRAGIGGLDGQRLAYILMHAELDAVVCSGARRGKQHTYALLAERAPRARTLPRDAALAELAGRYFRSRGPASVQDFAKWSGLAASDARAGAEAMAPKLEREVIGGRTYWSGGPAADSGRARASAQLLSIYDEYVSSYRDRGAIGDPESGRRLVAMGNALAYIVLVDGQVAGTWRRTIDTRAVHVRVTPFRALSGAERAAVAKAAGRFAAFLDRGLMLDIGNEA